MPDQPADPIHYDMKIPPEPKQDEQERDTEKKHGDKINIGSGTKGTDPQQEDRKDTE